MASQASTFRVPRDGKIYIDQILDRCISLIQCGIWGDFHPSRLRLWMSNFMTDEERYFAACVLDSLIYRSKNQTLALIRQLFQRTLPDLTRLDLTPVGQIEDWQLLLRSKSPKGDPSIRLVAAVTSDAPPGKSAHVIARYMMQDLSINKRLIINPWDIGRHASNGVKVFVFIDDFLGTGDQFDRMVLKERAAPFFSSNFVIYAPLVGHTKGIQYLQSQYRNLRVSPVELLDDTYGLFHGDSPAFKDQTNTPESAKRFYYRLLKAKGIFAPERRGFGHLELTYAFEHATPDNCLPILWWRENSWHPLFEHRA